MLTWKVCFGKYALFSRGKLYDLGAAKIFAVLFSYKHGLFSSHWLIPIGLIGFVYLARTRKFGLLSFFLIFFCLCQCGQLVIGMPDILSERGDLIPLPFVIIGFYEIH